MINYFQFRKKVTENNISCCIVAFEDIVFCQKSLPLLRKISASLLKICTKCRTWKALEEWKYLCISAIKDRSHSQWQKQNKLKVGKIIPIKKKNLNWAQICITNSGL